LFKPNRLTVFGRFQNRLDDICCNGSRFLLHNNSELLFKISKWNGHDEI
jgi:hypothetical protein